MSEEPMRVPEATKKGFCEIYRGVRGSNAAQQQNEERAKDG